MSAKHTPGPWGWDSRNSTLYLLTFSEDAAHHVVASMDINLDAPGRADARLIATAPELLAALKDVVNQNKAFVQMLAPSHRSELSSDPLSLACNRAEAIIAKAEGTE